jgi:hypothetical protein
MNLYTFALNTLQDGGRSYNPTTGQVNPSEGYMVAVYGSELVVPLDQFGPDVLKEYYLENASKATPNTFVGSWVDGGNVYLDLSNHVSDLHEAVTLGMKADQKAIYDCEAKQSINLPTPQKCGTSVQQSSYIFLKAQEIVDRKNGRI